MSAATTIALVSLAAGSALSAVGAISQGKAAQDAANFNAQVANNNAIAARAAAAENATRERRLGAKRRGANRALDPDKLDLLEDSAIEEELNVRSILHGGELKAVGFQNNAALSIAKGQSARASGFTSAFGSLLQGGATAAGSFGGGSAGGVGLAQNRTSQTTRGTVGAFGGINDG